MVLMSQFDDNNILHVLSWWHVSVSLIKNENDFTEINDENIYCAFTERFSDM